MLNIEFQLGFIKGAEGIKNDDVQNPDSATPGDESQYKKVNKSPEDVPVPMKEAAVSSKFRRRHLEATAKYNKDKPIQRSLNIIYKKKNGRTVKRKVTPYEVKGHLLIGHDHKRKALRSFIIESIKDMDKAASFNLGFIKTAGGPGSGVSEDNTAPIADLKTSPIISIGKRKSFFESHQPRATGIDVSVSKIKYKGQEKMVPKKVSWFLEHADEVLSKPVDLLQDKNGDYHVIDGHHRVIAAKALKKKTIKANVYHESVSFVKKAIHKELSNVLETLGRKNPREVHKLINLKCTVDQIPHLSPELAKRIKEKAIKYLKDHFGTKANRYRY